MVGARTRQLRGIMTNKLQHKHELRRDPEIEEDSSSSTMIWKNHNDKMMSLDGSEMTLERRQRLLIF